MAFLHYLIVTPIFINIKKKPFLYANVIALIIVVVTSINIPNVDITGREISAEIINSYALLFFVVVIWYMGVLTQRQKEEDNNKVFSELGKVSSFLLHELSSPVSRLANKASNSEEHSREIDQIKNLLQLTKAISQKRSEIKKDEFKLSTLSNYYIDEYSRTIDRLDIEVDVEERNRVVNSNATFVDIIVKNIIKNAIEHLKTLESNNKKIVIREISDEKKEVLRISNTAEKKSKKEINEMFSPLYSTKKTKYGSNQGIGLFISKRMAEGLGININCFCKDDLIHFDVEFPLS
jgi:signal transduction histidine kinase